MATDTSPDGYLPSFQSNSYERRPSCRLGSTFPLFFTRMTRVRSPVIADDLPNSPSGETTRSGIARASAVALASALLMAGFSSRGAGPSRPSACGVCRRCRPPTLGLRGRAASAGDDARGGKGDQFAAGHRRAARGRSLPAGFIGASKGAESTRSCRIGGCGVEGRSTSMIAAKGARRVAARSGSWEVAGSG